MSACVTTKWPETRDSGSAAELEAGGQQRRVLSDSAVLWSPSLSSPKLFGIFSLTQKKYLLGN